ncbi:hypothetical protein VTK26DRAFT_6481 [Humicola hyalothermophila]
MGGVEEGPERHGPVMLPFCPSRYAESVPGSYSTSAGFCCVPDGLEPRRQSGYCKNSSSLGDLCQLRWLSPSNLEAPIETKSRANQVNIYFQSEGREGKTRTSAFVVPPKESACWWCFPALTVVPRGLEFPL